jgi:hypothetical protein
MHRFNGGVHRCFSLDILPPRDDLAYGGYAEILDLNRRSLDRTVELPPHLRKSVYAVHQFISPRAHMMFRGLLFDDERARYFENFAVGGMASLRQALTLGYIPWVLPLIEVARFQMGLGRMHFGFHSLGNAAFSERIIKVLFVKLLEDIHGLRVTLTWDTNSFFKAFTKDRKLPYADVASRRIGNLSVTSKDLYKPRLVQHTGIELKARQLLKDVLVPAGVSPEVIDAQSLYSDFHPNYLFYTGLMLVYFRAHTLATQWCMEDAEGLYGDWRAGRITAFAEGLTESMGRIGGAEVEARVAQTVKSMELLTRLDSAEANKIINIDMLPYEFPQFLR